MHQRNYIPTCTKPIVMSINCCDRPQSLEADKTMYSGCPLHGGQKRGQMDAVVSASTTYIGQGGLGQKSRTRGRVGPLRSPKYIL